MLPMPQSTYSYSVFSLDESMQYKGKVLSAFQFISKFIDQFCFTLFYCRFDWIGLVLFYKRKKFSLVSEDSFLIYTRVGGLLSRAGLSEKVIEELRQHLKDVTSVPKKLDPPGCLLAKLRLKEVSKAVITVAMTHISWTQLKYPVLQLLEVCHYHRFSMSCLDLTDVKTREINK